ncbi:MAG: YgcG family protein [Steroidobacteraceae bacterium]
MLWRWVFYCLLCLPFQLRAAEAVPVPALSDAVTDLTQTLTAEQIGSLDTQLRAFSARKGSQFAILMVPTTQPESIEQYSIRVVDAWKLGRKQTDDGVLLLIAKQDRAVRIEVGYGLEGVLNDATSNRIIRQLLVPQFQANNYYQGISDASARIMQLIDGEVLPAPNDQASEGNGNVPWPLLLFVAMVGGSMARSWLGRVGAASVTSGAVGLIAWLFMSSMLVALLAALFAFFFVLASGANGGSGGWSSGSRGGWSSGSGGFGGGGFRGGGGGFGGGGASGRW